MLDAIQNDEHLNLIIANWLFDVINNYPKDKNEAPAESFCIDSLAKIHRLITVAQDSNDPTSRAILARVILEVVADMFTVYRASDQDVLAQAYLDHHYNAYKKLHESINKAVSDDHFPSSKRIFDNQDQSWTGVPLMSRVKNVDKIKQSLNDYDLFSHYVHLGGSGSTHLLDQLINQTIFGKINYQLIFAIIISLEFGVFTKLQFQNFIKICNGMVGEALRYGNFQRIPKVHFSDTGEVWTFPQGKVNG